MTDSQAVERSAREWQALSRVANKNGVVPAYEKIYAKAIQKSEGLIDQRERWKSANKNRPSPAYDRVLGALSDDWKSTAEMAQLSATQLQSVDNVLRRLVADGRAEQIKKKLPGKVVAYWKAI